MWPFRKGAKEENASHEAAENILHDLKILARIEGAIARFYHLCGKVFPKDRAFWEEMTASERTHVQHIHRMQELIRQSPSHFQPRQQFSSASIRLFELSIKNLPDRDGLERITREELFRLVAEVESSAVETGYGKIGTTGDEEFNRLAARIDADTSAHHQALAGMLAKMRPEDPSV